MCAIYDQPEFGIDPQVLIEAAWEAKRIARTHGLSVFIGVGTEGFELQVHDIQTGHFMTRRVSYEAMKSDMANMLVVDTAAMAKKMANQRNEHERGVA